MSDMEKNASLIRELRRRLGLTQERFAARLGVTLPTINRWENGRSYPSPLAIQTLKALAASMGQTGEDLLFQLPSNHESRRSK